ncbi:MAG TPA: heme exporter protein CcmD [Burkholderiaceae bacterium]
MNWNSAAEFFAMGGYGLYVWGAYGLTAVLLALEVRSVLRRRRHALDAATARSAPASSHAEGRR